jgi:WD repeat-containing protein 7
MDLLRALFIMSTATDKKELSTQNLGTQARLAVVQIATNHTPLFTATLSMEILQPQSVQDRRSTMQLLAFFVRKVIVARWRCFHLAHALDQRPLVIYSTLPRLLEAVVKSLDPTSTSDRDAVFDAATEILGHVVQR